MNYSPVARVTHYYNKIGVAVLALTDTLTVGDAIHIIGHTTDFCQQVKSLQIEHGAVMEAAPGDDVALKVIDRVRAGDQVFKIGARDALEFLSERKDLAGAFM
jgi:hypothetical protein